MAQPTIQGLAVFYQQIRAFLGFLSFIFLFSCEKTLTTSGALNLGIDSVSIQSDSVIRVFSYMNGSPEYLTDLTTTSANQTGDNSNNNTASVVVPRNLLVPKLNLEFQKIH
jgi:hypothetical protein